MSTESTPPAPAHKLPYRRDIDGLRAIAVLSVIVFHVFEGSLSAGYIGVDIFFVISGFLITKLLIKDCEAGDYSILVFYERRIRRIMPALLLLVAVVTIASAIILLSHDLIGYAKSALATLGFVSNVYFWRDTNYFSTDALTKPLLHTWSLGIEEQFYILFPILVYFAMRYGGRRLVLALVAILSLFSFAAAVALYGVNRPLVAFYLIPTRAWELGLGALVACIGSRGPGRGASAFVAIGLLAIIAYFFVDPALFRPLPPATFAVPGAALIIWAGARDNAVSRLLGSRPMVGTGLISYSLYLWHWPIFVLARYVLVRDLTRFEQWIVFAAGFLCAYLSWRFVEAPFRGKGMPVRRVLLIVGGSAAIIVAALIAIIAGNGFPSRFQARAAELNRNVGDIYKCPPSTVMPFGALFACPINLPSKSIDDANVVLFGNSHALMYHPAVEGTLRTMGEQGILVEANGCLPSEVINNTTACIKAQRRNIDAIVKLPSVHTVIISTAWALARGPMVDADGHELGPVPMERIEAGVEDTMRRFAEAGKRTILVGPIPDPGYDVASVISRELAFYGQPRSPLDQPRAQFDREYGSLEPWIRSHPLDSIAILPSARFCDAQRCSYLLDGEPAYADDNHLARTPALRLEPLFTEALREANAGSSPTDSSR